VLKGGKPAAGVKVTFHPKFDTGAVKFTPSGVTDKDGRFVLSTAAANDGAPPGDYSVTFELLRAGTDKRGLDVDIDAWKGKYADPATTKWNVTVQKGENTFDPFRLD
jgi:5-hydroxyisourate hydrolase-like protein (transthyretin family)